MIKPNKNNDDSNIDDNNNSGMPVLTIAETRMVTVHEPADENNYFDNFDHRASCFFSYIEWKKEEIGKINELMSGPERKAALASLLEQEAYLIASIGRHKLQADVENEEKRTKRFLNKVCRFIDEWLHFCNRACVL